MTNPKSRDASAARAIDLAFRGPLARRPERQATAPSDVAAEPTQESVHGLLELSDVDITERLGIEIGFGLDLGQEQIELPGVLGLEPQSARFVQ